MLLIKNDTLVAVLILLAGNTFAAEETPWPEELRIAGEIIISPKQNTTTSNAGSGSSNNREKARSYQKKGAAQIPSIVIVPEEQEEEGILSPRGESAPSDNRSKAREYLRDPETETPASILVIPNQETDSKESNLNNLERNRNKARKYSTGETAGAEGIGKNSGKAADYLRDRTLTGVVGTDGVLVVICAGADNASGFIGDTTASGSVFTIMINGKAVKARCK